MLAPICSSLRNARELRDRRSPNRDHRHNVVLKYAAIPTKHPLAQQSFGETRVKAGDQVKYAYRGVRLA